jgi:hypothetical protein
MMHAQTGAAECHRRAHYIVGELDGCQRAHGHGFVAGITRRGATGAVEPARRVFEEIARGDIGAANELMGRQTRPAVPRSP